MFNHCLSVIENLGNDSESTQLENATATLFFPDDYTLSLVKRSFLGMPRESTPLTAGENYIPPLFCKQTGKLIDNFGMRFKFILLTQENDFLPEKLKLTLGNNVEFFRPSSSYEDSNIPRDIYPISYSFTNYVTHYVKSETGNILLHMSAGHWPKESKHAYGVIKHRLPTPEQQEKLQVRIACSDQYIEKHCVQLD